MEANIVKTFIGTISVGISYVVGGIGVALTALIILMVIDFITGLMVGAYGEGLSSKVGIKGLIRKVYILMLIGAVYTIQSVADLSIAGYTGDGLAIMFAVLEFVSIVENGGKLGVPIPAKFTEMIAALKNKSGVDE